MACGSLAFSLSITQHELHEKTVVFVSTRCFIHKDQQQKLVSALSVFVISSDVEYVDIMTIEVRVVN